MTLVLNFLSLLCMFINCTSLMHYAYENTCVLYELCNYIYTRTSTQSFFIGKLRRPKLESLYCGIAMYVTKFPLGDYECTCKFLVIRMVIIYKLPRTLHPKYTRPWRCTCCLNFVLRLLILRQPATGENRSLIYHENRLLTL